MRQWAGCGLGTIGLFLVHLIDYGLVVLIDNGATHLQRIGQFARFHREMMGQQGETFDLLIARQRLLQRGNALHHHVVNLRVGA